MSDRITSVGARSFDLPFVTPFQNARVRVEGLSYVRVEVACGSIVGRGEATAMPGYSPETIPSMLTAVNRYMGPAVVGMDPLAETLLDAAIDSALPANPYARSALELALLELRAKLLEVPAYVLLGGACRDEIRLAGIVSYDAPEGMAARARWWADRGAAALQVKLIRDRARSVATVAAVRQAVGPEIMIAVDGNGSFTSLEALRTMDELAAYHVQFFEQPVASDDIDGMALLVRRGALPVVADESLYTARDALRLRDAGACHGFNIKVAKSGVAESRRIIAIADAAGLPYGLGTMLETGFGTLAQVHFAATLKATLFPSEAIGPWLIEDDVTGVAPEHGSVELSWAVPTGPGWGKPA